MITERARRNCYKVTRARSLRRRRRLTQELPHPGSGGGGGEGGGGEERRGGEAHLLGSACGLGYRGVGVAGEGEGEILFAVGGSCLLVCLFGLVAVRLYQVSRQGKVGKWTSRKGRRQAGELERGQIDR